MYNYTSCIKRTCFVVVFFLLIIFCPFSNKICCAVGDEIEQQLNDNIENVLDDIDFSELNNYSDDWGDIDISFENLTKDILNDEYKTDYNSLLSFIKSLLFKNFKTCLRFLIFLIIISLLFEIFKTFCSSTINNLDSGIKIIFSFLFSTFLLVLIKKYYSDIFSLVNEIFNFSSVLFPILIGLVTASGSAITSSVFGSFSVFLLETGSYLLKIVLLPLALSILILSLFSSIFSNGKISRVIEVCKLIFKYTILVFLGLFGLLSTTNIVSSAMSDGVNLRLTKFAIKNYVPILGGYISDGFDFLHSCSVLIKNAIGFCSIIFLVYKILEPLVLTIVFSLGFKFLSAITSYIGSGEFSGMFNDLSKAFSNFLTIILGSFLIIFIFIFLLIVSVGVI